jgi:hypothetical protein
MLYGLKDLKPGMPITDEQDIKNKRRTSAKEYHHKGNAEDEQPFNFLNLCAENLLKLKFRKDYLEQLEFILISCEKRNYDDKLCRNFIEDFNERVITQGKEVPFIPFEE